MAHHSSRSGRHISGVAGSPDRGKIDRVYSIFRIIEFRSVLLFTIHQQLDVLGDQPICLSLLARTAVAAATGERDGGYRRCEYLNIYVTASSEGCMPRLLPDASPVSLSLFLLPYPRVHSASPVFLALLACDPYSLSAL